MDYFIRFIVRAAILAVIVFVLIKFARSLGSDNNGIVVFITFLVGFVGLFWVFDKN